jgi:hypothetical protein
MICPKLLRWRTPPLSTSLKPAQTLPGDRSFALLKAALGKKADVEMLVMGAGTAPHDATKKFGGFRRQLSHKPLMSLRFPGAIFWRKLQVFGTFWKRGGNFLEVFGSFWSFLGTHSSNAGTGRRGVELRAPDRKKHF